VLFGVTFFKIVTLRIGREGGTKLKLLGNSTLVIALFVGTLSACGDEEGTALVKIKNDFNNPEASFQPPWTICKSSYLGVEFGKLGVGETSQEHELTPGLDYVLMVAAWNDPTCSPENALPIASKNEEEVVDGQSRTVSIGVANHQGACPPEGVAPIPEAQYNRILQLWPEFNFRPYAERRQNAECL